MKKIPLTQGYYALISDRDYKRVSQFKWYAYVDRRKDGTIRDVSAARSGPIDAAGKRKPIQMHRFILECKDSEADVDHKDHNGLNNQRLNLRLATYVQNQYNRRGARSKSSFIGVSRHASRRGYENGWEAYITVNKKRLYLGFFKDKVEAAKRRDVAARKYHGKFASLNFTKKRRSK